MTIYQQWHLILGIVTSAVLVALVPVAWRQSRLAADAVARRYWQMAAASFAVFTAVSLLLGWWILESRTRAMLFTMQVMGLMVVLGLGWLCRVGFQAMREFDRLRERLRQGEQNLRHYQRNLESLVERRTNALREEVTRRREAQDELSRHLAEVQEDMKLARDLQQALLSEPPRLDYCALHAWLLPHGAVSGDTYAFGVERDILRIFVGDAMGHGVAAALLTNITHAGLHQIPVDAGGRDTMDWLNGLLASHATDAFITGVHITLNAAGVLQVTSAGSPEVLVRRASGELQSVPGAGLPLGMLRELPEPYRETGLQLHPGDRVYVYTDGLYEWRNAAGLQFGQERLRELLANGATGALTAQGDGLLDRVREFAGATPPPDDVTLVVVEFTGC